MMLGQSAGTAASFAIDNQIAAQDVDYDKLKIQLEADKQILTVLSAEILGEDAIIADSEDASSVKIGAWTSATSTSGYNGSNYLHDNNTDKGTKSVQLIPTLPTSTVYNVYLRWTSHDNRAPNVPITVVYSGGTTNLTVDQTVDGSMWNLLGAFPCDAGTSSSVLIENAGTTGYVVADAAAWALPAETNIVAEISAIVSDPDATEGSSNDTARITIVRTTVTSGVLVVSLGTSGSAQTSDYSPSVPSTVTFNAGESLKTISVTAGDDGLAEGDETLIVSVLPSAEYTVGAYSNAVIHLHDAPYDAWRFAHFTSDELGNPAVSGSTADPDNDGCGNLGEYFANANPNVNDDGARLDMAHNVDSLTFTLRRNPAAAALTVGIETAASLTNNWQAVDPAPSYQILQDYPWETLNFTVPVPDGDTQFWRARIVQP